MSSRMIINIGPRGGKIIGYSKTAGPKGLPKAEYLSDKPEAPEKTPEFPLDAPSAETLQSLAAAGRKAKGNLSEYERSSLAEYRMSEHTDINRYLKGEYEGDDPEKFQGLMESLDNALAKSKLPQPVTTYRGVTDRTFASIKSTGIGRTFVQYNYVSTSVAPDVAIGFSDMRADEHESKYGDYTGPVNIVEFRIPQGASAFPAEMVQDAEMELLLPREQTFRLVSVDQRNISCVRNFTLITENRGKVEHRTANYAVVELVVPPEDTDKAKSITQRPQKLSDMKEVVLHEPKVDTIRLLQGVNTYSMPKLNRDELNALVSYVGMGHNEVNRYLKGEYHHPEADIQSTRTKDIQREVELMDCVVSKATMPIAVTAYRGVTPRTFDAAIAAFEKGEPFTQKNFGSTTLSPRAAIWFSNVRNPSDTDSTPRLIEIQIPRGAPVFPMHMEQNDEQELILPRGSQFKITGVTKKPFRYIRDDGVPEVEEGWFATAELIVQEDKPSSPRQFEPAEPTKDTPSQPGFVYHATNVERAREIAEDGLHTHKPNEFTDQSVWPDGLTEKRAYFSPLADRVWQFAPEEGRAAILRVHTTSGEFKRESGTGDVFTKSQVPADKIEILGKDGSWTPIKQAFPVTPQK